MEGQRAGLGARVTGSGSLKIKQKCPGFHELRRPQGRGLEDTPTCDSDLKLLKSPSGIILGSELPGISKVLASGVWEDEGSQWSVLCCPCRSAPPTPGPCCL